jgi:S1-C subfamily serine protease
MNDVIHARSFFGLLRAVCTIATAAAALASGLRAQEPSRFEPAEISIGEPLELPTRSVLQQATAAGNGWLGLTADDSLVPGRLVVVDVAQPGPAAQAGIKPQDQVLAINGKPLRNSDQLAAELAAIAPGSDVKMAVGRGDRIDEVVVKAAERPVRTAIPPAAPTPTAPLAAAAPAGQLPPSFSATPAELPAPQAAPAPFGAPVPQAAAPAMASVPQPLPAPVQARQSETVAGDFGPANIPAQPVSPPQTASIPTEPRMPAYVPPAAAAPSYVPPAAAAPAFAPSIARPAEPAPLMPAEPRRVAGPIPSPQTGAKGRTALGVRTLPVDPGVQARFGLPEPAGALVIGVVHDLPASRAGVPPGSVIVALDDKPVRSPNELTQVVTSSPADRPMTLQYILPGGEKRRAEVSLQSLEVPLEQALVGPPR